MSSKPTILYSLLLAKCPRCRQGNMFAKGTLYTTKFADMHKECPCCGQDFEPEPGYYYGAMYVSFAFNVGIFLAAFLVLYLTLKDISLGLMIGVVLVTVVGFMPLIFRLSRAVWIHIFIRYEGPCSAIPHKARAKF